MQVPARFMKVAPSYKGRRSDAGWLEIDLKPMDLEGLSKIYVNLAEVEKLKGKRDEAASLLDKWDEVFDKADE